MSNPSDVQRAAALHRPLVVCEHCGDVAWTETDGPGPGERFHVGGREVVARDRWGAPSHPELIQCFGEITVTPHPHGRNHEPCA